MSLPEFQQPDQIWNNLELAKLIIATLALIIFTFLAFRYIKLVKQQNNKQKTNEKLFEKKVEIYDRIVTKLYDILCFYCYVGNWIEITPIDIKRLKKELDKEMNIYTPLLSDELGEKYIGFIQLCFISNSGWEHDSKIKSLYEKRQEHNVKWNDDWIQYFDTKNVVEAIKMKEKYNEMIDAFRKDLSL